MFIMKNLYCVLDAAAVSVKKPHVLLQSQATQFLSVSPFHKSIHQVYLHFILYVSCRCYKIKISV